MNNLNYHLTQQPNTNSSGDPSHEYVDITFCNNNENDLTPQPIIFNQIKSNNILDTSSDYYLSCVRWSMESEVPQIIPELQLAPIQSPRLPLTGATEYVIDMGQGLTPNALSYITGSYERIAFTPNDFSLQAPAFQPLSVDEYYSNPYFYIYNINNFLALVNGALSTVFNNFKAEKASLDKDVAPRFQWNSTYNKIDLLCSESFIQKNSTNDIFITMNTKLYNLFNTFTSCCINTGNKTTNEAEGHSFALYVRENYQNPISVSINTGTTQESVPIFVYPQDSSSVPSWVPIQSIEFITHSIPVNPSNTGAPNYVGNDLKTNSAPNTISNIITDFQIPLTIGTEYTRNLLYFAVIGEYRLFDLISQQALQNLNITVGWLDKYGFTHPFLIKNGASASIKLLFRKKTYNGI
jgi:hypothetical protein